MYANMYWSLDGRWRQAARDGCHLLTHIGVGITKSLKSQAPLNHSFWGSSSCPASPSEEAPVCPCVSLTSALAKIVQNSFQFFFFGGGENGEWGNEPRVP